MKLFSLFVALLSSAALSQTQTRTLPRGLDTTEGNLWQLPGWSNQSAGRAYLPARVDYCYRSTTFPWDRTRAKVITELRARIDSTMPTSAVAHRKEVALTMSVDGYDPARPRMNWRNDATHGSNKRNVMTRQWVSYPASRPNRPAAFAVILKLTTPYLVPANSQNLVIQYNAYRADVGAATIGWRADSQEVTRPFSFGTRRDFGASCPTSLNATNLPTWGRGDLTTFVDTGVFGRPTLGWIGVRRQNSFQFPGTQCFLHVDPILTATVVSEQTGNGRAWFWWGRMPNLPAGFRFAHQYAVIQPGFPLFGTIGLSEGVETTFGTGWTGDVPFSSVASFGSDLDPPDPDRARIGGWLNTRAVIWQVVP